MRETIAAPPTPNINATRLKLKRPTSNQTSEPIIVSVKAIIVVIFIFFPPRLLFAVFEDLLKIKQKYFPELIYQKKYFP